MNTADLANCTLDDIGPSAYLMAMASQLLAVYSYSADRWKRFSLYLNYVTQGGHVDSYPHI